MRGRKREGKVRGRKREGKVKKGLRGEGGGSTGRRE